MSGGIEESRTRGLLWYLWTWRLESHLDYLITLFFPSCLTPALSHLFFSIHLHTIGDRAICTTTSSQLSGNNPLLSVPFSCHMCIECACKQWHTESVIVVCFWSYEASALMIVWTLPVLSWVTKAAFLLLWCYSYQWPHLCSGKMHIMNTDEEWAVQ